jgi:hypothetical protein
MDLHSGDLQLTWFVLPPGFIHDILPPGWAQCDECKTSIEYLRELVIE